MIGHFISDYVVPLCNLIKLVNMKETTEYIGGEMTFIRLKYTYE